jgi:hypothetical protein
VAKFDGQARSPVERSLPLVWLPLSGTSHSQFKLAIRGPAPNMLALSGIRQGNR